MYVICFLGGSVMHYFSNRSGIRGNVGCETMHSSWDCGIEAVDSGVHHCLCGFHNVGTRDVVGVYPDGEEVSVRCRERCRYGGWHLESGYIVMNSNDILVGRGV